MSDSKSYIIGGSKGQMKRLRTWREKNHAKEVERTLEVEAAARARQKLKQARADTSIANGLVAYRQKRNLTQTQMATEFGITRRALYNYETGQRSVSGELLEAIVKRGDCGLHELFSAPQDPLPVRKRRETLKLTIDLVTACVRLLPETDILDIKWRVVSAVDSWPARRPITDRTIERVALSIEDDILSQDSERIMWEEIELYRKNQKESAAQEDNEDDKYQ